VNLNGAEDFAHPGDCPGCQECESDCEACEDDCSYECELCGARMCGEHAETHGENCPEMKS
jgi:hypothetical protein